MSRNRELTCFGYVEASYRSNNSLSMISSFNHCHRKHTVFFFSVALYPPHLLSLPFKFLAAVDMFIAVLAALLQPLGSAILTQLASHHGHLNDDFSSFLESDYASFQLKSLSCFFSLAYDSGFPLKADPGRR